MGIIALVKDVKAVADAIKSVKEALEILNPDRAVILEVQNLTDQPLRLVSQDHTDGGFSEPPSIVIPPQSVDIFGSKDDSVASGTEGKVLYESDLGFLFRVEWKNQVLGSPSGNATVLGTNSGQFEAQEIIGVGETAKMQYSVIPGVTARQITRIATNSAGAVGDIAVANVGARGIVTAVRGGDKALRLIQWEASADGRSIRRLSPFGQAGEASDIDIARGRLFVTACRAANKNLLLISWDISANEIRRVGDSRDSNGTDGAGEASRINIVALTNDLFVTALKTADGKLRLITWRLESSGELKRVSDSGSQAGDVNEIALVRVQQVNGNHRVVTAVQSGSRRLQLISWNISANGLDIRRLTLHQTQAGTADLIRACVTTGGHVVTAVRTNLSNTLPVTGDLLLISWSIDQNGTVTRLADTHGQAGAISSNAVMTRPTGVVSAVGTKNGLKLISWTVTPQGAIRRAADSGEQAGAASLVTLCQSPFAANVPICTAIRNGAGNLMLIGWTDV